MKNFNIWSSRKNAICRGGYEKPIYRGNWLKRGLGQFTDLRGGLARKSGVDTPMHTMLLHFLVY